MEVWWSAVKESMTVEAKQVLPDRPEDVASSWSVDDVQRFLTANHCAAGIVDILKREGVNGYRLKHMTTHTGLNVEGHNDWGVLGTRERVEGLCDAVEDLITVDWKKVPVRANPDPHPDPDPDAPVVIVLDVNETLGSVDALRLVLDHFLRRGGAAPWVFGAELKDKVTRWIRACLMTKGFLRPGTLDFLRFLDVCKREGKVASVVLFSLVKDQLFDWTELVRLALNSMVDSAVIDEVVDVTDVEKWYSQSSSAIHLREDVSTQTRVYRQRVVKHLHAVAHKLGWDPSSRRFVVVEDFPEAVVGRCKMIPVTPFWGAEGARAGDILLFLEEFVYGPCESTIGTLGTRTKECEDATQHVFDMKKDYTIGSSIVSRYGTLHEAAEAIREYLWKQDIGK
jgi:hypothetical protein